MREMEKKQKAEMETENSAGLTTDSIFSHSLFSPFFQFEITEFLGGKIHRLPFLIPIRVVVKGWARGALALSIFGTMKRSVF